MIKQIIGGIFSPVVDAWNGHQDRKQEMKKAKHDLDVAIIQNKQRLAENTLSHNTNKEMEMLRVARPWMRWVITAHIMVLIDVCVVMPEHAKTVFATLENMPSWVVGLFVTVFGFYFAVNQLTEHGGTLVKAWKGKSDG